jgi:Na+/H+ antiporter NhaD/arsenite permease-like protein
MNSVSSAMNRVFRFYYDGFRSMSWWGKRIWIIILIKLFVMFIILKIFFFQDFLQNRYDTDEQKSEYVLDQLINSK